MVVRLVRDPFDREDWLFEIKWDGFRAIAETDGAGNVSLYSRNHDSFNKRFPDITQTLRELKRPAVLDGEIVALDEHGKSRFEWLVNRGSQRGTLIYYVFDLLGLDGKDLRQMPLLKRKARLARLVKKQPRLLYVDHLEGRGLEMFAGKLALGLEGVVAKDAKSPYIVGPRVTWHWLKIKNPGFQRKEPVEFRVKRARRQAVS